MFLWVREAPTSQSKERQYAACWTCEGVADTLTRSSRDSLSQVTIGEYSTSDEHELDWTVLPNLATLRLESRPFNPSEFYPHLSRLSLRHLYISHRSTAAIMDLVSFLPTSLNPADLLTNCPADTIAFLVSGACPNFVSFAVYERIGRNPSAEMEVARAASACGLALRQCGRIKGKEAMCEVEELGTAAGARSELLDGQRSLDAFWQPGGHRFCVAEAGVCY